MRKSRFHDEIEPARCDDAGNDLIEPKEEEEEHESKGRESRSKQDDDNGNEKDLEPLRNPGRNDPGPPKRFHVHVVSSNELGQEIQQVVDHWKGTNSDVAASQMLNDGRVNNLEIQQGETRRVQCSLEEMETEIC